MTFFHFFSPKIALPSTLRAKKLIKYKFSWKVYEIEIVTFDLNKIWYFTKFEYLGHFLTIKGKKVGENGPK